MKKVNLLEGPIDSSLRAFAFPLALSFVINMVYAWVDMYYVSRLGDEAIAALGATEQLLFLIFAIGFGFAVGSGIIIARRIGEGNQDSASHTVAQALVIGLTLAITLSLMVYFGSTYVFQFLKLEEAVVAKANSYIQSISIGIIFNFTIFQINSIIRSTGNSFYPLLILITSNVLNAAISPIFIFGLGPIEPMGIFGAGLGTSTAQFLGMLFGLYLLNFKFGELKPKWKGFSIDFTLLGRIILLGIPASMQLLVVALNRFFLIRITMLFSQDLMTSYIIGLRVDLLVFMSIFALGAAIEVITSQNLGAKKIDRVFKYYYSAIKQISGLMIFLTVVVWLFGHNIAEIFTDNEVILEQVKVYLRIISFSYVTFAIGIVSIRVVSGAGAYFKSLMMVVLVIFIIQLPLAYILSQYTGLQEEGIWYGILISQVLFAVIGHATVLRKRWITVKV